MSSPPPDTGRSISWPQLGALELEDLLDELRSRARLARDAQHRMSGLLDAVMAVSSDLDLSEVLARIVRSACDLVGARYGALGVIGPEGERLVEFITHGLTEEERGAIGELPRGHGILGLLIRDPRPRRIADLGAHPDSSGFPPHHPPMRSFLGTPVRIREQVFGNLYMSEKRDAPQFSDDDEAILIALAAAAGVAIENARLYDRSRRQRQLADAVGEITQLLLEGGAQAAALRMMAQRSSELTDAELSVVALYDDDHSLVVRAASRPDAQDSIGTELVAGRWDDIVAERVPLLLVSRPGEQPPLEAAQIRHLAPVGAHGPLALVTIAVGEADLGVLAVAWSPEGDAVAAESLEVLQQFAGSAALALEAGSAQRDRGRMELLEDHDRIARDMHDHVIQRMFATGLSLQSASRMTDNPKVRARLSDAVDELDSAIKDIRRTIFALHRPLRGPDVHEEIEGLVDGAARSLGFRPELQTVGRLEDLRVELEPEVLAVLRESLSNVVRHAHAGWCSVQLEVGEQVTVRVSDDGVGSGPAPQRSGLANLSERAGALGGSMTVGPHLPQGTVLEWSVPAEVSGGRPGPTPPG